MRTSTEILRRLAKRWRRRFLALYHRVRHWRRYHFFELRSGDRISVDMWNRNWRLFVQDGGWEDDVESFVHTCLSPGDVVIDIGAQVGMLSSQASSLVGPFGTVLSFEPDPENFAALSDLAARNGLHNLRLFRMGLSDREGEFSFRKPLGSWGSFLSGKSRAALDSGFRSTDFVEFTVQCLPLDTVMDQLPIDRVTLIKLDVDGPEVQVLKGAVRTLQAHRPLVIVEVSKHYSDHGYSVDDLFDLMSEAGYDLFYTPRNSRSFKACKTATDLDIDISMRGNAVDFFAIPANSANARHERIRAFLSGKVDGEKAEDQGSGHLSNGSVRHGRAEVEA